MWKVSALGVQLCGGSRMLKDRGIKKKTPEITLKQEIEGIVLPNTPLLAVPLLPSLCSRTVKQRFAHIFQTKPLPLGGDQMQNGQAWGRVWKQLPPCRLLPPSTQSPCDQRLGSKKNMGSGVRKIWFDPRPAQPHPSCVTLGASSH